MLQHVSHLYRRKLQGKCSVSLQLAAHREAQQGLGRHHDERFAEVADHLAAEQVEVLCRGRGVHHPHIHIVTVHALLFIVTHLRERERPDRGEGGIERR